MQAKITSDAKFQVLSHSFSVTPSVASFYLWYNADGINWTMYRESEDEDFEVPSGETLIVTDIAFGQYIYLEGYVPSDKDGNETEFGTLIY